MNQELETLRERSAKLLIDHLHVLGYSGAEAENLWGKTPTVQITGWKLVPLEPTDEMLLHFAGTPFEKLSPSKQRAERICYQAMLAAAPAPPMQEPEPASNWTPDTKSPKPISYAWECNECGSQEFTMCVSEHDVNQLGCGNCGSSEWHKAVAK
jgi:hypothetical protein